MGENPPLFDPLGEGVAMSDSSSSIDKIDSGADKEKKVREGEVEEGR